MAKTTFWTPEENAVLRDHYATGGYAACQPLLPNRSRNAIRRRASSLGIGHCWRDKPRQDLRRAKHDPRIDAQITAFYQKPTFGGLKALARQTGCGIPYLKKRAATLGVTVCRTKQPDWSEAELERLMELAALNPEVIRRKLVMEGYPQRSVTAIVIKRKRLGVDIAVARNDAGWYNTRQLEPLVGKDAKCIAGWIARGWLKAERAGTARQHDEWRIHEQDLKQMLMNHAECIELHRWHRRFLVQVLTDPAGKVRLRFAADSLMEEVA